MDNKLITLLLSLKQWSLFKFIAMCKEHFVVNTLHFNLMNDLIPCNCIAGNSEYGYNNHNSSLTRACDVLVLHYISQGNYRTRETDNCFSFSRAGLHDNVPDRPSAKAAPVGCQLATMALKSTTVTIPKGGLHCRSCHTVWDVSASGLSRTRLADFLPPWQ